MHRVLGHVVTVGGWAAALALVAVAVAWVLALDRAGLDALVQPAEPLRALGCVLVGMLWALRRHAAALLALAAVTTLALGMAIEARGPAPATAGQPLRIYAANVWAGNRDVAATAASVAEARADVVVLIEVGDVEAGALDRILAGYPHRVSSPRVERRSGAARSVIAARRPLTVRETPDDDGLAVVEAAYPLADGRSLTLSGVHLTRPWPLRPHWAQPSQAARLALRVQAAPSPTLVVGDFNGAPHGRAVRRLRLRTRLHVASSAEGTWPSALPSWLRLTIDEALATRDVAFTARRIGRPTGSDHLPVILDLRIAPQSARGGTG